MADAHYVVIAPHNPNGPVCTAAAVHVAASIPNFVIMEEGSTNPKDYNDIFVDGWKPNSGGVERPRVTRPGNRFLAAVSEGSGPLRCD